MTAGERLKQAIESESPLQCVGVINACFARFAEAAGFRSLYLSGGGVAAASCGVPDLGITTMQDVVDAGYCSPTRSAPAEPIFACV